MTTKNELKYDIFELLKKIKLKSEKIMHYYFKSMYHHQYIQEFEDSWSYEELTEIRKKLKSAEKTLKIYF